MTSTDTLVDGLLAKMTLAEKLGQLNLVTSNIPAAPERTADIHAGRIGGMFGGLVECSFGVNGPDALHELQKIAVHESRLGIPLLFGYDVIHGHQTVLPIPLALSCSWNPELIEACARTAAREAAACGLNWVFSPMLDIGRDPRWGRIAEGSGEDPFLGARIAAAMVRGLQGEDLADPESVMACIKHFIAYGAAEGGRDYNNADLSPQRLFEVYLPPFLAALEAGAGSAMMSFSAVNGMPSHADADLLRLLDGVLKVSDFDAIPEMIAHGLGDEHGGIDADDPLQTLSERALRAGVQMDMMGKGFATRLEAGLEAGRISQAQIDAACRAVLEAKAKLGLFADPFARFKRPRNLRAPEYRVTARQAAAESCVLLKNDGELLPLAPGGAIAVVGPLADDRWNLLGPWSFQGDPGTTVSVLEGIRAAAPDARIVHARGCNLLDDPRTIELVNFAGPKVTPDPRDPEEMIAEAVAAARAADVVVAVLGEAAEMSGEAASRMDIGLPAPQRALLHALAATGRPVVLVLAHGRPLTLAWEAVHVPAILAAWFGGCEAGNAIADLLFGAQNPGGRLTTTWPRHVGQIPLSYDRPATGRPGNRADDPAKYTTRCYLDGPSEPLFPFGFGLGYTRFAYGAPSADKTELRGNDVLAVSVEVANVGTRAGAEVVQMYVSDPVASVVRPLRRLRGFEKIALAPGETRAVTFRIATADLEFVDARLDRVWEPGRFVIGVGPHSDDLRTVTVDWRAERQNASP